MQRFVLFALCALSAHAATENPLGKVIQLMDDLAAKVTADGEREAKAYKEYVSWCDDVSANTRNDIKTKESQKSKLEAKIDELTSNIEAGATAIEELGGAIAKSTSELNDATAVRKKEEATFAASEKELVETVDTLDRAVGILQREMAKNPAALAQLDTSNLQSVVQTLTVVVDAASFNNADKKKLLGLVQQASDAEDSEPGAPAAAVYKSHSGGIFDLLEDLREKAEGELSELRKAETTAAHNYAMLKQSLDDKIAADTKDMNEEKAAKAAAEEGKATAEGDLTVTVEELKTAQEKLATANANCMTVAADHEQTVASRAEELKVIAEARKILVDTSSGAVEQTYSFLQVHSDSEVIGFVKNLAKQHHSAALSQLASRMSAVVRLGARGGNDVFGKVKGLINDMIGKLEKEASEDATEKAYCDEQMSKTEAKKSDLDDDIAKLTSKIDQASSKSAELKEQVKELQAELAALAKEQAEMDKIRAEENAAYVEAKADLELGLSGVRKALDVLRDYYGSDAAMLQQPAMPEHHEKSGGAAGSIIGILEVCESDFATNLAKEESEESDAAAAYDKTTQENKIAKTEKEQGVKYKTQEAAGLDKAITELSGDLATATEEHDAVMEYYGKIKERCIAKPETYEERKKRREAEISGLKEALSILENETAFVQRKRHGSMRGVLAAA
jgi:uncharacterized coiled-coil DUF342 family protein